MHVITRKRILEAAEKHPQCESALFQWYRLISKGTFHNFAELKATFGSVDKVGHLYLFDISGNKLRLIAAVHFNTGKVFIRHILTHEEYDSNRWKMQEGLS